MIKLQTSADDGQAGWAPQNMNRWAINTIVDEKCVYAVGENVLVNSVPELCRQAQEWRLSIVALGTEHYVSAMKF